MFFLASSNSQGSYKLADSDDPEIHPSEPQSDPPAYKIGYGKPPRHAQFRKGTTGCPTGRPKRPPGISIKEILDGDQRGKNGEVISRREPSPSQDTMDRAFVLFALAVALGMT